MAAPEEGVVRGGVVSCVHRLKREWIVSSLVDLTGFYEDQVMAGYWYSTRYEGGWLERTPV